MPNITFLVNGRVLRKFNRLRPSLDDSLGPSCPWTVRVTERPGHAVDLAEEAVRSGADVIVGVGGDGTVHELVNGVMSAPGERRDQVTLGILPIGTGNDTARTLGFTSDVRRLAQGIRQGRSCLLDVGEAAFTGRDGRPVRRYVINIADIGLGGQVVMKVNAGSSRLPPSLVYMKAIISAFLTYIKPVCTVEWEGDRWTGPLLNLVVANGRYFGSGLHIAPQADPADGLFQVLILGNVSVVDYLKNLGKLKRGERLVHPEVRYLDTAEIRISGEGPALPVDLDGEFCGYAPLEVRVRPSALRFLSIEDHQP